MSGASRGKPSVLGIISGAIAGLGTITPASGFVLPWHGIVIGIVAGAGCYWACTKLKLWLGYDDSLDVFGVHGVGGTIGTTPDRGVRGRGALGRRRHAGLLRPARRQCRPGPHSVHGVAVTIVWSGVATFVILKVTGFITELRVAPEAEQIGLDVSHARRVDSRL